MNNDVAYSLLVKTPTTAKPHPPWFVSHEPQPKQLSANVGVFTNIDKYHFYHPNKLLHLSQYPMFG